MIRFFPADCGMRALLLPLLILTACASVPSAGDLPDPRNPPRQTPSGKFDKSGRELLTWDRPGAFGKVPGDLKIRGDSACLMARADLEATGFHPKALDLSGREISGGAFYCTPKATGFAPVDPPPRLILLNGVRGWDRPSAFGQVPEGIASRGHQICASAGPGLEAVAYHPAARDEQGRAIPGGGFFCAPAPNR